MRRNTVGGKWGNSEDFAGGEPSEQGVDDQVGIDPWRNRKEGLEGFLGRDDNLGKCWMLAG